MAKEGLPGAEWIHEGLIEQARRWVRDQAKSIEGQFSTLNDGSQGLVFGVSSAGSYKKVLRPDGEIDWVDYHRHILHERINPAHLLIKENLLQVQAAVEVVRAQQKPTTKYPRTKRELPAFS